MQKLLLTALFAAVAGSAFSQQTSSTPAKHSVMEYRITQTPWNPDSLGNHRVVVEVTSQGAVARVEIPWRRRDTDPVPKGVIVVDAHTNKVIQNQRPEGFSRVAGTVSFEPTSGPGTYYIYYMPYLLEGTYYPTTHYMYGISGSDAAADWVAKINQADQQAKATAIAIESVDAFNQYSPMEVIATPQELDDVRASYVLTPFLVYPEDRMHPIRMTRDLPYRWIQNKPSLLFQDSADRGENYAFQIGIFALEDTLEDVHVEFSALRSEAGVIPQSVIRCINNTGVNWIGVPETYRVDVPQGQVQALWCTVDIPEDIPAGLYKGTATVLTAYGLHETLQIELTVNPELAVDHGVNEPWKQTRLTWLNSTLAENNTVIRPYTPLKKTEDKIALLGRQLQVAKTGFPAQIESYFTSRMTSIADTGRKLLTEPMHFHFNKTDGAEIKFSAAPIHYSEVSDGTVAWEVDNHASELDMLVKGSVEFDGFVNYNVKVTALQDLTLDNISLHLPMVPAATKYILGLGFEGQQTPEVVDWKWQVATKNQDGAWLGDVNAGLQFSLRDEHYVRPLNTNFYLQKPLLLPVSWGNDGKGGIKMERKGAAYLVDNYTGARTLRKGDTLYFNFRLLITPFHTLDTRTHFANRYIHKYINTDSAKTLGATVINIHQGTPINPYINYPFIRTREMKAYIDSAHSEGMKVKIYNTVRELSNRAYELPALFSLGHEIYSTGKGGGYAWLREHLDQDYIAAWYTPEEKDAAIVNSGMSRWHNYYVEGMNWLTKNMGIDGVYLDDVAFDRDIMKRIKRVLTADNHPGLIDLHSASQYNKADGYINSSMLYMELFPYLNRLWFGERFDYEKTSSDYYLTEMSGIPFGLMGEMLENDGNPWRGMVYGMTDRLMWSKTADPRPLWKLWDQFGIEDAEMIGYWATDNPITTDNPEILATVFQRKDKVLIAVASWAPKVTEIHLKIDWKALGMDPAKARLRAPAVDGFQPEKAFKIGAGIPVAPAQGWILELTQ